jgi:predicted anti-sigma-YlaC factor YlaD
MDCNLIRAELLAYHLGASESASDVDAHLLDCRDCLAAFLRVKREIEAGARGERPSPAVRDQLRARVAKAVEPSLAASVKAWWARPVPRYRAVLVFAAAALLIVIGQSGTWLKTETDPARKTLLTDSADPAPESLDYY